MCKPSTKKMYNSCTPLSPIAPSGDYPKDEHPVIVPTRIEHENL